MPPSDDSKRPAPRGLRAAWAERQPAAVFLAVALTLGLAVMFANPPFQAPDEGDHFYRAFQLSEGTVIGSSGGDNVGGSLPKIAFWVADPEGISFHPDVKMTRAIWEKKANPAWIDWSKAERVFCGFPHTVIYPPVSYVPQTMALFLGRHLQIGPLGLMYLARLAGFVASVGLGYAALCCLPIFRWSAMVVLLCPMSLYLFGSVASDGVLIAAAFLLVALVVRIATAETRRLVGRELAVIVILASGLTMAKAVYLPIAGVALVFVVARIATTRRRVYFGLAWVACCLIPVWWWGRIIASLFVPGRTDIPIDPAAQGRAVLAAPLAFLSLVGDTIWDGAGGYYQWTVGVLGWGDTWLPEWFYVMFGWALLACLIDEAPDARRINGWQRVIMLGATAAAVVMIFGAQYATWNAPGSRAPIEGIEGRYFLPLAPLVLVSFPFLGKLRMPRGTARVVGTLLPVTGAIVCFVVVLRRYYFG